MTTDELIDYLQNECDLTPYQRYVINSFAAGKGLNFDLTATMRRHRRYEPLWVAALIVALTSRATGVESENTPNTTPEGGEE